MASTPSSTPLAASLDFRPCRPRLDGHRLEHLGCENDRDAAARARRVMSFCARGTDSCGISRPRSPRATITRIAHTENLVEMLERLRPLQLRHDRRVVAVRRRRSASALPQIGRGLHEAQRHHVHAERQAELQIVDVLRRHRRRGKHHARRVDALVLRRASRPPRPSFECRSRSSRRRAVRSKPSESGRRSPGLHALGEACEGRRDMCRGRPTSSPVEMISSDRPASAEWALRPRGPGPDLRSRRSCRMATSRPARSAAL